MKKAKIEELENFVWECPYKKCGHRNETSWFNTEELENEKIGIWLQATRDVLYDNN